MHATTQAIGQTPTGERPPQPVNRRPRRSNIAAVSAAAPGELALDAPAVALPWGGAVLVPLAMMLVAGAAGLAAHLHLGLEPLASAIASGGLMVVLLAGHAFSLSRGRATRGAAHSPTFDHRPDPLSAIVPNASGTAAPARVSEPGSAAPVTAAAQPEAIGSAHPIWTMRPAIERTTLPASANSASTAAPDDPADVALVHDLIRRLANDINAGRREIASRDPDPGVAVLRASLALRETPRSAAQVARPPHATAPEAAGEKLEHAIAALRETAQSMRAVDQGSPGRVPENGEVASGNGTRRDAAPQSSAGSAVESPVESGPPHHRHPLEALASAVQADRFDVMLDPVSGLDGGEARHFELIVRFCDTFGHAIDITGHASAARGTGLLPMIDAIRLAQAARLSNQLDSRRHEGQLFSPMHGESLDSRRVLAALLDAYEASVGLQGRLILSFAQSDVRVLGPEAWRTLLDLSEFGVRFCLRDVTDLDMSFEDLANVGFAFVRLDADVLLAGMRVGESVVPPSDVCFHLAGAGLTVIAGAITDETMRARLFGFGVLLGQGALFGGPRLVRRDIVAHSAAAA